MTRINTNISSLNAQKTLARTNVQLQEALTRLSTGLRINVGKDDPAGLIASEVLRSDIVSVQQAISNSERANQMIATADSALGQISSLLTDIRGLVSEAANEGALSAEQVAANQLQVDSSLEAIDRIVQVTQFQGKRLLDGNMGFVTQNVDSTKVSDLDIQQAVFGTSSQISVGVDVVGQAEQASLSFQSTRVTNAVVLQVGGYDGFEAFSFGAGSTVSEMRDAINLVSDVLGVDASLADRVAESATAGQAKVYNSGGASGFTVTAADTGENAGNFTLRFSLADTAAVGGNTATWNAGDPNVIDVTVAADQWTAAVTDDLTISTIGTDDDLQITSLVKGAQFNALTLRVTDVAAGSASATYDYENNRIDVALTGAAKTTADLRDIINQDLASLFLAATSGGTNDTLVTGTETFGNSVTGVDGGVVSSNGTLTNVADKIDDLTQIAAITVTGGANLAEIITASGTIGSANSTDDGSATDDPNNMVQLSGTDKAENLDVTFAASGASQSFSIDYTLNDRTNGYSTAYLTSSEDDKDAVVKVVYTGEQGQQWDGITVTVSHHATNRSVVWNEEDKTLTVYAAATASANDVRDQINTYAGNAFTASVIGGGGATASAFTDGDNATTADGKIYDSITVNLATDANGTVTTTAAEVVNAINNSSLFNDLEIAASHMFSSDGSGVMDTGTVSIAQLGVTASDSQAYGTTAAVNGVKAQIKVTALTAGDAYNNVKVVFDEDGTLTADSDEYATYDASNKILTFHVATTSTAANVVDNWASNSGSAAAAALFTAEVVDTGSGEVDEDDVGWLSNGVTYSGTTTGGLAAEGNFDEGDVVGTGGLELTSTGYGSKRFVEVKALSGTFTTVDSDGNAVERDYGADANVRINGIGALADGLDISLNTSTLDLSFTLASSATAGTSTSFQITSGGAQFQLGPDVVSNQQARIGINSMSTAVLGGATGRLYQLRSGGDFALETDTINAAKVIEEVVTKVTSLRGRLGAFQKTTLDTNIATLNDTLENLTNADSSIRDADFAAESAALTRAQILVQSGISVLSIANSNPQNVLALLR